MRGILIMVVVGCGAAALTGCSASSLQSSTATKPSAAPSSTATQPAHAAQAATHAPACALGELSTSFLVSGRGTGLEFGTIRVTNVSAHPCSLTGAPRLVGVNSDGARDTPVSTCRRQGKRGCPTVVVLAPGHEHTHDLVIAGDPRDDARAANGLCASTDEVTPARLEVTIGRIRFSVRNASAVPNAYGLRAVSGCRGAVFL